MAGILVVADHVGGRTGPITAEMVGAAAALREELEGPLRLLLIGFRRASRVPNTSRICPKACF